MAVRGRRRAVVALPVHRLDQAALEIPAWDADNDLKAMLNKVGLSCLPLAHPTPRANPLPPQSSARVRKPVPPKIM